VTVMSVLNSIPAIVDRHDPDHPPEAGGLG
jgi:hypothetical protein